MHIPNYRIEKKIGQGGMAVVYLAVHEIMQRQVALKVMLPHLSQDKGFKESFLREGQVIAQLEHPNIVRIYDISITDDIYYMSMEYHSGGTLKDRLLNKKYSIAFCITLLQQIGAGLTLAHQRGYIHRDIKPANILFSKDNIATLADFGIAKLQNITSDLTKMGYIMGTAQYMSPEQSTTQILDQRSDIYSLGLVFYEMLTGEKVVRNKTGLQAMYHHTNLPIPILPDNYQHLQSVLNKVLARNANDRFSTVNEFIETLITTNNSYQAEPQKPQRNHKSQPVKKSPLLLTRWIKPILTTATLAIMLLTGFFFYLNEKNKELNPINTTEQKVSNEAVSPELIPQEKLQPAKHPIKKISYLYQPHNYYNKLEQELALLTEETVELLTLSPDNEQAQQTRDNILKRYHSFALMLLKSMRIDKAKTIINTGLKLSTTYKPLKNLKKAIERRPETLSETENKHIQALMNEAKIHTQAGRYVLPTEKNALDSYQKILVLAPRNEAAVEKINAISSIFENKIENNLDKNTYEANELLNQALALFPFNEKLLQFQNKIKTINNL
jgi:serine/threonine protein kinase